MRRERPTGLLYKVESRELSFNHLQALFHRAFLSTIFKHYSIADLSQNPQASLHQSLNFIAMHSQIFIPLIGLLAVPFLSAQTTSEAATTPKPCAVPEIAFTGFNHVINLTVSAPNQHTVDGKPLRLLRDPHSAEETPILGPAGELMGFSFKDSQLSISGGRLAYDLPTIEIFPPVLVPWKFGVVDNPRTFIGGYACDEHGKQILVLKPDGAQGI